MNQQITLSKNYVAEILLNKPLIKTEPIYWRYKHYIESLRYFNAVNSNLENYMVIQRKKHLEEKLNG